MKLVDFRCEACGKQWEEFEYETPASPQCGCGSRRTRRLLGAPAITGSRLYGHVGLKEPMDSRTLEKHLAEKNSWLPTPREAREISQMTEAGIDPVEIRSDPKRFDKAYDKAVKTFKEKGLDRTDTVATGGE